MAATIDRLKIQPSQYTYRPRMEAILKVPMIGDKTEKRRLYHTPEIAILPIKIRKMHLTLNDHNLADECRIEAEYMDIGLDPRVLSNATVDVFFGEAKGGEDEWKIDPNNDLVFAGIMKRPIRGGSEEGLTMSLEFLDYTSLFLENKHYPPSKDPLYSQTLTEIWQTICDNTGPVEIDPETKRPYPDKRIHSTVQSLRDKIEFWGFTDNKSKTPIEQVKLGDILGKSNSRLAKLSKMPRKHPDMDSWAIWQQCVGALGLVSFIRQNSCIVTTARNLYSFDDPPLFIWGQNILSINEERLPNRGKGIQLRSFDPLTNSLLEANFPPDGDERIIKKTIAATTKTGKPSKAKPTMDREVFYDPGITDPDVLQRKAERVYEEWSRQELEGKLVTADLRTITAFTGSTVELKSLASGNTIIVGFDPETKTILKSLGSERTQMSYLIERGYSIDAANYIIKNLSDIDKWDPKFLIKQTDIIFDTDENSGNFTVEIGYHNHIDPSDDGSVQKNQSEDSPPPAEMKVNAREQRSSRGSA